MATAPFLQGSTIIPIDPRYYRPTEVDTVLGDSSLARQELGWQPKVLFGEMIREMTLTDLDLDRRDKLVADAGYQTFSFNE